MNLYVVGSYVSEKREKLKKKIENLQSATPLLTESSLRAHDYGSVMIRRDDKDFRSTATLVALGD